MNMKFLRNNKYFVLVFAAGVVYTLYMQTLVRDEVFFSGDGGLKALMTKQFARGDFSVDLKLDAPDWVKSLWERGLYLFKEPFAYKQDGKYYLPFDFLYPLLNVPFYKLFGYRGFHIPPLIATWIIWLLFYRFDRDGELGDKKRALALGVFIFSSFLPLFSPTYWEHTPAIAMAFGGMVLLNNADAPRSSMGRYVSAGLLIGLSAWFRPELYCLVGALTVTTFMRYISWRPAQRNAFFAAMYGMLIVFWTMNYFVYGHPLSVHSYQIIKDIALAAQAKRILKIFVEQGFFMVMYFPLSIFYAFAVAALFRDREWRKYGEIRFWAVVALLMLLTTPLIVPNHGVKLTGPRFMLITLPIISMHGVMALKRLDDRGGGWRNFALVLFVVCFAAGVHRDTYLGMKNLKSDFSNRVLPSLQLLRSDPGKIVVVEHQFTAQELEAAFDSKIFFRARSDREFQILLPELIERDYREFMYFGICLKGSSKERFREQVYRETIGGHTVIFHKLGDLGEYCVFDATIIELD